MNREPSHVLSLCNRSDGACLAVKSVTAKIQTDGPFARTELSVTFANDLERAVEGDLVFPLPPFAALESLVVRLGARTIEGAIRPRSRAQAEYHRAVQAGRTAALAESNGEDLARLTVAPIDRGEAVEVTMTIAHPLTPISDGHRLIVPLTYMPRFVESETALTDIERAAVDRPRPATLEARAHVDITIRRDGANAPSVRVPSHTATVAQEARHTRVTIDGVALDRDLQVEIVDRPAGADPMLWSRHDPSDGPDKLGPTTVVAIMPPAFADEGPTIPRTITFLVDRSGSMGTGPMQSAIRAVRGSLRALDANDLFNIIVFDDTLEALGAGPLAFTQEHLVIADRFIGSVRARGGTQASMAITAALDDQPRGNAIVEQAPRVDGGHRLRVVVFMTDGDVAGADAVLRAAKTKLVDTRLHVIGIGDAVNHAMLAALAELGGGTYTPVSTNEDLERAIARLKNAILAPLWTGVRVFVEGNGDRRSPKELEPRGPFDLFAGEPLLLAWRGAIARGDRLVLDGQRRDGKDLVLTVPLAPNDDEAVAPTVWALLKNKRLTYRFDADDDPALEALGVAFKIANRATAFVGVQGDDRALTIEGSVAVSLPLPRSAVESPAPMGYGAPLRFAALAPGAPAAMPSQAYAAAGPMMAGGSMHAPLPRPAAPVAQMFAPAMQADLTADAPTDAAALTDDEAGLRALILRQNVDGLFGDLAETLAAVAALAAHGHTAKQGLFRGELRRTLRTVRRLMLGAAAREPDQTYAALILTLLGEAIPSELPASIAAHVKACTQGDVRANARAIRAALAEAPRGWKETALGDEVSRIFFAK